MNTMNRIDKRLELLKKLQAEMDHRTQIEEEAYRLISNCEFAKANDLLKTLDDEIIRQIERELDELDGEEAEALTESTCAGTCEDEQLAAGAVDVLINGLVIEPGREDSAESAEALQNYADAVKQRKK